MNIVLIDCHDLGDWLGCHDKSWLHTPNLDRLAADGARFTNHFATAPQCIPSRAGIYCGRLAHRCGVLQQGLLAEDSRCIAKHLADYGYSTHLLGGLNIPNPPSWAGFETNAHMPKSAEDVRGCLQTMAAAHQPFFLHASFGLVHRPYGQDYDRELADRIPVPPILPDNATTRRDLASLALNATELDRQAGLILDAIDSCGLRDDTLVMFTTDHGVALARHKHTVYDAGIRTALLMRMPGVIPAGLTHEALLSNVDLFPTVCELAGVPVPDDLDGMGFVGLFREDGSGEPSSGGVITAGDASPASRPVHARRTCFAAVNWARRSGQLCYVPHRCLRTERYKLIKNCHSEPFYLDGGFVGRHAEELDVLNDWQWFGNPCSELELYDCEVDPWEQNDLANDPDHADLLHELHADLLQLMTLTGDPVIDGPVPNQTGEPVKPQWVKDTAGRYRLDYDLENETRERPFHETWGRET